MSAEGVGREDLTEARRHGERAWEKWTEFTEFFGEGGRWLADREYGRGIVSHAPFFSRPPARRAYGSESSGVSVEARRSGNGAAWWRRGSVLGQAGG
jgi:hypothetical protein